MSDTLENLSQIVGWISFFTWSISFYGQFLENYDNQSVEGYSLKFQVLNFTGFAFYSIYCTRGYFYQDPGAGTVDVSDVAFAYHAFFMTCMTGIQCIKYPKGQNSVGPIVWAFSACLWIVGMGYLLLQDVFEIVSTTNDAWNATACLGYYKVIISFVKYTPQVYWNWKRKSTKGWSIFNILMDITGGTFQFVQIVIDAERNHHTNIFSGGLNIAKFLLSICSIFFDIIFILQHYVIYPYNKQPLLQEDNYYQEINNSDKAI